MKKSIDAYYLKNAFSQLFHQYLQILRYHFFYVEQRMDDKPFKLRVSNTNKTVKSFYYVPAIN